MEFYKKNRHTVFAIIFLIIGCTLALTVAVRTETEKLFFYWIGLVGGIIWLIFGLPIMLTWTIAIDNEAVYALYSLFGKVIRIRKKILFKNIRLFTINDVGWFQVLPVKGGTKYKLREVIIIQKDIKNYEELVYKILKKLDPSIVDERVNLFLAGKFKEAGVSKFYKDVFK